MRSALVAATFALAVFAAPIAEPNPIYKSGGTGCARVIAGVCVKSGKREAGTLTGTGIEAQLTAKTVALEDYDKGADVHTTRPVKEQKRSPRLGRPKDSRSTEDGEQDQVEARFSRGSHPPGKRDAEPEPFSRGSHPPRSEQPEEKRSPVILHRPKNARSTEGKGDPEFDFEPRTIRGGTSNKRTADPEPINRGLNSREAEPFGRAGAGKRFAEPEPFSRAGAGKRAADPEPFGRAGAGRRDAEPINRIHG